MWIFVCQSTLCHCRLISGCIEPGIFLQTQRCLYAVCTVSHSDTCLFQSGVCGCEKGYTEVMTTHGFLDYCTKTPGADNKKADVKTSSGRLKPGTTQMQDFFGEWSLQPLGPGIWNADEQQADVGQWSVALSYSRISGRLLWDSRYRLM